MRSNDSLFGQFSFSYGLSFLAKAHICGNGPNDIHENHRVFRVGEILKKG